MSEHIIPVLRNLHWLPICERTKFKILVIVYKIAHGQAPLYLLDLLTRWVRVRTTRQTREIHSIEPDYNNQYYGARAFSVAALRLWNKPPHSIRTLPSLHSFKSNLKTHLFRQYFSHSYIILVLSLLLLSCDMMES